MAEFLDAIPKNITTSLAIWGAGVSTILLGFRILDYLSKQPRLSVEKIDKDFARKDVDKGCFLDYRVVNVGGTPITITDIRLRKYDTIITFLIRSPSVDWQLGSGISHWPRKLDIRDCHDIWVEKTTALGDFTTPFMRLEIFHTGSIWPKRVRFSLRDIEADLN